MEHDAWFFVGVFVFIFLVWISVGGPSHPISFTGPTISQPTPIGSGTYLQLPQAPFVIGGSNVSLQGSSGEQNYNAPLPSFVGGSSFGSPSVYRGIVSMNHYVSSAGTINSSNEYIEISVAQNAGAPVVISGWKLLSEASGNSAIIPKGTEVPISGTIGEDQDIILTPGSRAIIVTGQSPIGASFRENKCIGYFSTFQKFYPQLPQNCPTPSDELASFYGAGYIRDTDCIEYMKNVPRCQISITPPAGATNACKLFMETYLNYNGCVNAHRNDANFKGDTWRIYLGRSNSMWRARNELVKLLDKEGRTVDAFGY